MVTLVLKGGSVVAPASVDVYAFGVLLFEIIVRQYPFDGMDAMEIGLKVALEDYRPQIPDYVPEALSGLIQSCWQSTAEARPSFYAIQPIIDGALGRV
jgi:hypothetical protein